MKVAVLSSFETVPWAPLVLGLMEAVRAARMEPVPVRVAAMPDVHLELVHHLHRIDVALLPFCRWEWDHAAPYLQLLRSLGVPIVPVLWDDPYDLEMGAWLARQAALVLTPEPAAVDAYGAMGVDAQVLPPLVCEAWHHPHRELRGAHERASLNSVLWFGGTRWRPRQHAIPLIRDAVRRAGRPWQEAAGVRRWIVGPQLTEALHGCAMTFDLPRFDLPTRTNPWQVPCTHLGPRAMIAAACQAFCLLIDAKPNNTLTSYPEATLANAVDAVLHWSDPGEGPERRRIAAAAHTEWRDRFSPGAWADRLAGWLAGVARSARAM